jgi:WD40 repeat protein
LALHLLIKSFVAWQVWALSEGRAPWLSRVPSASADEVGSHESGVWALDVLAHANLVASGTDDGTVAVWDLRSR